MNKFESLPGANGVYLFYNGKNLVYIGKAINIKERVKNHFNQPSYRDELFIKKVNKIKFIKTNSEIEALILEANLIKKYQPKYNIAWRDDKNYFYVAFELNNNGLPYVFITHRKNNPKTKYVGPFVEGTALKKTLRFLRRALPYYSVKKHSKLKCTYCHLDLCPGPNPDIIEYRKNIKKLILILQGKRNVVLNSFKKEMKQLSRENKFEEAGRIRDKIYALSQIMAHTHVLEISNLKTRNQGPWEFLMRTEAYDVSNIQGKFATASMVVFEDGKPNKNLYRKFKIKLTSTPNDTAMLKEALQRRFSHHDWPQPSAILIDGGKAQFNIAVAAKKKKKIKILSIAKGKQELFIEGQKNPIPLKNLPQPVCNLIKHLDDEAHRFAIAYHKKLRKKQIFN
jgi:excinuclease ABC subunit C